MMSRSIEMDKRVSNKKYLEDTSSSKFLTIQVLSKDMAIQLVIISELKKYLLSDSFKELVELLQLCKSSTLRKRRQWFEQFSA